MEVYVYDEKYLKDAGDKPFVAKPQYVRGGYIFSCPVCGDEISSHQFLNLVGWESAIEHHLMEKHDGTYLSRCKIDVEM